MEFVLIFVGTFVLYMLVFFLAYAYGKARMKKKIAAYEAYITQNFPHIPKEEPLLAAKQLSKKLNPTIGLKIDSSKSEIIVLTESGKSGVAAKAYPYHQLTAVNRTYQILSRGLLPKTYSYEETLALSFADGNTFRFVAENVSNKYGSDQGADFVRNFFSPWEQRLKSVMAPTAPPSIPGQ